MRDKAVNGLGQAYHPTFLKVTVNESNLPPGVTSAMIDAHFSEVIRCIVCKKDITDDKAELVCRECGEPLCDDCSDEYIKMCKYCFSDR